MPHLNALRECNAAPAGVAASAVLLPVVLLAIAAAHPPAIAAAHLPGAFPVAHQATFADLAVGLAVHHPATSTAPAVTIGGRRSVRRTTTGADDSTAPRGATDCRHGAGARRRRRFGMGRCLRRGGRRLRRSTTSASTSNRCGTPATTSGASISSEFGFHYRFDRQPGETAASDNPRGGRQRFSAAKRIGRCLRPPTNVVATC